MYETAGDVLCDGTNTYEYDAEGRQTGVLNTLNGLTGHIYCAEGTRVMKVVVNGFGPSGCNPGYRSFNSIGGRASAAT